MKKKNILTRVFKGIVKALTNKGFILKRKKKKKLNEMLQTLRNIHTINLLILITL